MLNIDLSLFIKMLLPLHWRIPLLHRGTVEEDPSARTVPSQGWQERLITILASPFNSLYGSIVSFYETSSVRVGENAQVKNLADILYRELEINNNEVVPVKITDTSDSNVFSVEIPRQRILKEPKVQEDGTETTLERLTDEDISKATEIVNRYKIAGTRFTVTLE